MSARPWKKLKPRKAPRPLKRLKALRKPKSRKAKRLKPYKSTTFGK